MTISHEAGLGGQSLSNLRAVVTGAAGGIGAAISRQLISQGAVVHGLDRDAAGLKRAVGECGDTRFVPHLVDLADRAQMDKTLDDLRAALSGRCDILVNNAGVSRLRTLEGSDDALLDWIFAVNFNAGFRITRALLPALRASGRGSIVNVASELALVGHAGYSAYCATGCGVSRERCGGFCDGCSVGCRRRQDRKMNCLERFGFEGLRDPGWRP
jgi:meso-butanediol dehydrogenase/(S,S)-butanediol dehydrogenase/diacetyl reductase